MLCLVCGAKPVVKWFDRKNLLLGVGRNEDICVPRSQCHLAAQGTQLIPKVRTLQIIGV